MSFDVRLTVIALVTFLAAGAAVAAIVWVLAKRVRHIEPEARARTLFRLRLLPVLAGLVAALQGIVSFVIFEPRTEQEVFGRVLVGLALAATALFAIGTVRLIRAAILTRRTFNGWIRNGTRIRLDGISVPSYAIDADFPIVAVVGLFQPQLVIDRSVLAACAPEELRAIFAHEQCHVERHDNLRRSLLTWLPDVLSLTGLGRALTAAWHEAAEGIADEAAGRLGPTGRLDLASALLRVARLAPPLTQPIVLPASALYRGEDLADRVRRLLNPPAPLVRDSLAGWRRVTLTASILVGGGLALHAVHEVVETLAGLLP